MAIRGPPGKQLGTFLAKNPKNGFWKTGPFSKNGCGLWPERISRSRVGGVCYAFGSEVRKPAMSRYFESKHAFAQRVSELDLDEIMPKLTEKGWVSFSVLAFATDFVPGTSPASVFLDEVVKPLVGDDQAIVDRWKPLLKRLFVEAYTMAAHDVSSRTDGADPDEPRRMPNAERQHRLQLLQAKFPGLRLEGELQPSYHLIDLCVNMYETGVVAYIGWERCTKRDAEVNGAKVEKYWKPDNDGRIRETTVNTPPSAEFGSDLLLKYALQRRGLALETANVCDFTVHELWVGVMFDALLAPPPPGYAKVSWNQLRQADQEVWKLVGRSCPNGLRWGRGDAAPFEQALKKAIYDPAVRLLMMPLPAAPPRGHGGNDNQQQQPQGLSRKQRRVEAQKRAAAAAAAQPSKAPRTDYQKGQGKGKGKDSNMRALDGKCKTNAAGEPICFNFNLRGCPNAAAGARCPRGWHVCAEPGCQKAHPLTSHS